LILNGLERVIYDNYREAAIEMREKALRYLAQFRAEDFRRREALKEQGIDPKKDADYVRWRQSHIATGRRWLEMMDTLAADMVHHNEITASAIRGHMPEVYATGYNYSLWAGETQSGTVTPFTLYDRRTVERLLEENPRLLPQPRVDIPKDMQYNQRLLTSQIAQGILQGETMDQIASRLSDRVAVMNRNTAMRTARTAVTGAENAGRLYGYFDLELAGIRTVKTWMATQDSRTRDSHVDIDGETVGSKGAFSNECMYPGDPGGPPEEVYNCRCTMYSEVIEAKPKNGARPDRSRTGMTYDDWKRAKESEARRERPRFDNPAY
jgi:SPP1 gp7 family putative phage head morphogenesis protein